MKLLLLLLVTTTTSAQVKYSPLYKHNAEDKKMVKLVEALQEKLLHSESFKKFMLNRDLIQTNGKSNLEVVEHLKSLKGNVPTHMYYSIKNVVGYRQPPRPDIYTNMKFHRGANACNKLSNMMHEGLGHSVGGYGHDFKRTKRRPYSVPYSLNAAVKALCKCVSKYSCIILDEVKKIEYKTVCKRSWKTLFIKKCYKVGK